MTPGNYNLICFFIHCCLDYNYLSNHAQRLLANTQSKSVLNPRKTLFKKLTRSATTAFRLLASPDNPAEKHKIQHINKVNPPLQE